jgi:hypothetical protein
VVVTDHHISQWDVIPKDTVPVVYRCETWLIIFSEEHRLRKFENRVLRNISGAKREFQETEENCILSTSLTQEVDQAREIFEGKREKTHRVLVSICEGMGVRSG